MKKAGYLLILLAGWMLVSCDQNNIEIDNPSTQAISLTLAGTSYTIPPGNTTSISLEPGTHNLQIPETDSIIGIDTTIRVEVGGIINPARAQYYIWTDLYGDQEGREVKLKEEWTKVGKKELFGDFFIVPPNQVYVEKKWDYGLSKSFPTDLIGWQLNIFGDKVILKSKLFRERQLIASYQQQVSEP